MHLGELELVEIEREYCRRSLANFAKRAWPILEPSTPLAWGWALDLMCEHLEAVTRGECLRLLINVPPGTMKSLLTSVIWPAWEWGPKGMAHLRYLGTAHKQDLAVRDSTKCRRLIQSAWYQKHWPVQLTGDQNAKTKFENDSTGFREAMAFTSMTGARGDRVILDDPHSVDDAASMVKLMSAVTTFREALPSRINNDRSAIVIIMQRLHESDVSHSALELGYQHLCLPMRYEHGRSKWVFGSGDPRTESGELLFPERFDEQRVSELERSLGSYASAGQLQQAPSPRGGGIFKDEWLRYWQALPDFEYRMIYADTALKTGQENDFSVFQHWGKGKDGKIYLLDMIRGKWESPQLLTQARAFWDKCKTSHSATLRQMRIEDKASGTGLIQQLKQSGIPVSGIQRERDKITRAYDVAPQVEVGNVMLPAVHPCLSDLLHELSLFPAAAHDDTVDPLMDAITDMLITSRGINSPIQITFAV